MPREYAYLFSRVWTTVKFVFGLEGFYSDLTLTNKVVYLDRNHYFRCTFYDCEFVYYGGRAGRLVRCSLYNPLFTFKGAAGRTLLLMREFEARNVEGAAKLRVEE